MKGKKKNHGQGNGMGHARFGAEVAKLTRAAQALAGSLDALGLPALTSEQRQTSMGKLRVGEAEAMVTIFDAMDRFPGIFAALAARDGGVDPQKVETEPARGALARARALAPLAKVLDELTQHVADAIIASAQQAKEVSVAAYQIGKVSAASDMAVAKAMRPALDFYGAPSQKRMLATKRAATKAKRAAKGNGAHAAAMS